MRRSHVPAKDLRPLVWMGSSKEDLRALPPPVVRAFGFALYLAQAGQRHPDASALRGFGDAAVVEVRADWRRSAFRLVYTTRYQPMVCVLHAFQKKSTRGIATPGPDSRLILKRLADAARVSARPQP